MKKKLISVLSIILVLCMFSSFATTFYADEETSSSSEEDEFLNLDYSGYSWDYSVEEDVTEAEDSIISGEIADLDWSSQSNKFSSHEYGIHGEIIDYVIDNSQTSIPEKYQYLIYKLCQWCDTKWQVNADGGCRALHGLNNYVVSLKFLWKFTRVIAQHEDGADIKADAENARTRALNSLPEKFRTLGYVTVLADKAYDIVTTYYSTASHPTHTEGNRCKYMMFGLIMHLIGDTYAHRFLVPKHAVSVADENSSSFEAKRMFKKSDFNDWAGLVAKVESDSGTWIKYVKKWYQIDNTDGSLYVDNPNFYPGRVVKAEETGVVFRDTYSQDSFDEIDVDIFQESANYIKLYNYQTYLKNAS